MIRYACPVNFVRRNPMSKKLKPAVKYRRKFHKQIENLDKRLGEVVSADLSCLDDIPNFVGKDEPIPFPYGSGGEGEDFGQWAGRAEKILPNFAATSNREVVAG